MNRLLGSFVLGATLVASANCGGGSSTPAATDTPAATTTTPTTPVITETFTGTVEVQGKSSNAFNVAIAGSQVNIILTAVGPPATIFEGLGIGAWTDGVCTLFASGVLVTQASATAQLAGTINAGAYCVQVFDAGNQAGPVTYSVTVNHY